MAFFRGQNSSSTKKEGPQKLTGYLIGEPEIKLAAEGDYSDDEMDLDFSDDSASAIKKVPLHKTKISIQLIDEQGEKADFTQVHGKFPLIGQWWQVTLQGRRTYGNTCYIDGLPSYRLRSDLSNQAFTFNRYIAVSLKYVGSVERKALLEHIKSHKLDRAPLYDLENLVKVVKDCASKQLTTSLKQSILTLVPYVYKSEIIRQTTLAIKCPASMNFLPMLMPRQFHSIIKHCTGEPSKNPKDVPSIPQGDMDFLPQIEKILTKKPWELAFSMVSQTRLAKRLPEVTPAGYEKASLWTAMKQPYKDAVMLYHVLKDHCRDTGDTYMNIHRLNGQSSRFKGHRLSKFRDAMEYLKDSRVVVEEGDRIYPHSIHKAECDISRIVSNLFSTENPFTFSVDFELSPLDLLAKDKDQRKAAEMISEKPVIVMSGRGGSGKTEVVARVCQVGLLKILEEVRLEHKQYMNDLMSCHACNSFQRDSEDTFSQVDATCCSNQSLSATEVDSSALTQNLDSSGLPDQNQYSEEMSLFSEDESDNDESGGENFQSNNENDLTKGAKLASPTRVDSLPEIADELDEDKKAQEEYAAFISRHKYMFTCYPEHNPNEDDWTEYPHFPAKLTKKSDIKAKLIEYSQFIDTEKFPPEPDNSLKSYILMTAPTGKAAKVLGKRAGFTGFTIHQVLWRYILWSQSKGPFPFAQVRILVIDECSLVAVQNVAFLLSIMQRHAKLKRIIFLGDILQLPSIEPGNFLTDTFKALSRVDAAIMLRTNHRSEGHLIVENAIRISAKVTPEFDPQRNFQLLEICESEHAELGRDEAVTSLIEGEAFSSDKQSQFVAFRRIDCEAVNNICSKQYTGKLCIDPTTKQCQFHENFKICCTKNGTVPVTVVKVPSIEAKTAITEQQDVDEKTKADPAYEYEVQEEDEESRKEWLDNFLQHYITEKIKSAAAEPTNETSDDSNEGASEVTADKPKAKDSSEKPANSGDVTKERRLCNGEIFWIKQMFDMGFITEGKKVQQEVWILEDEDGTIISIKRRDLIRECKIKPSWCRTIHTFQGSEIKHLAYVVGAAGRQTWQHVYTAVTRGKKSVSIIGELENLKKAVHTPNRTRLSSLAERLRESLCKYEVESKQLPGPSCDEFYTEEDEEELLAEEFHWNEIPSSPTEEVYLKDCLVSNDNKSRKRKRFETTSPSFDAFANYKEKFNGFVSARSHMQHELAPVSVNDESAPVSVIDESAPVSVNDESAPVSVNDESAPVSVIDESAPVSVIDDFSDDGDQSLMAASQFLETQHQVETRTRVQREIITENNSTIDLQSTAEFALSGKQ